MSAVKYGLVVAALLAMAACASNDSTRKPVTVKMECLAYVDYEECGNYFSSMSECKGAQARMVRSGWSNRERGACLKNVAEK
ncbi:MAG: hypothetical protein DHS20C11_23030 [Lysobacteraceae bacterium]|nr:MAG: hypothetical protein DHS20C11_23030 [Xanthomonadaceae bacterium]